MTKAQVGMSAVPDVEKQRLRAWLKMLKATRSVEAQVREKLRIGFGTTLPRFDVMAALHRFEGGLKMSELSSALRVSNGNVTGIIERLVADGAVLRVPVAGDKRATLVLLTKNGRDQFTAMADAHRRWISDIFRHVSADAGDHIAAAMDLVGIAPDRAKEDHRA